MDKTTAVDPVDRTSFSRQIVFYCPDALRRELARHPLAHGLHTISSGWFPRARRHFRARPEGTNEMIVIFNRSGLGWYDLGRGRQTVRPDQVLVIPEGAPHAYGADAVDPWSIHWVHCSGTGTALYASLLHETQPVISLPRPTAFSLHRLFRESAAHLEAGISLQNLLLASHVLRHILGLVFFAGTRALPVGRSEREIGPALALMRNSTHRSVTLAELAASVGLSPSRFAAVFRARTGVAPVAFHTRLRIQAAREALDATNKPIKAIAAECGFDDPYHFSRVFRRVTGTSPGAYRKAEKG
jgi:AraC-like DNA-binding protein